MKNSRFYVIGIIVIVFLVLGGMALSKKGDYPIAGNLEKGDLGPFQEESMIWLQGTWTFYEGMLFEDIPSGIQGKPVEPPHTWTEVPYGIGTYTTRLEGLDPEKQYGIYLMNEAMAYRLSAGGREIMANGLVSGDPETYVPSKYSTVGSFYSDAAGSVELVLEIANFDNPVGGFWNMPLFGSFSEVLKYSLSLQLTELYIFAGLQMLGIFFLALFWAGGRNKTNLLLGLLSLLVSYRTFLVGERFATQLFPGFPAMLQDRLLYLSAYLILPVGGLLLLSLGYRSEARIPKLLFRGLILFTIPLVLLGDASLYQGYAEIYKYLIAVTGVFAAYWLYSGIRRKVPGAFPASIAIIFIFGGAFGGIFLGQQPYMVSFAALATIAIFMLIQVQNFSRLKHQNSRLEAEVIRDRLTGAYNRLYLEEMMAEEEGEKEEGRWQVLFLDIDCFKELNDTYGHEAGDLVLKVVARRLIQAVRATDRVFRYGGDEFLILLEDQEGAGLAEVTERLRQVFRDPVTYQGQPLAVTGSLGGSSSQGGTGSLREAIRRSDEAMYEEKEMRKQKSTKREKGENADE